MNETHTAHIEDILILRAKSIQSTLRSSLLLVNEHSKERKVLVNYITVFHPHFIPWMAAMQNSCITPEGLFASSDNILLEIMEDHQKMLWDFMHQINIRPNVEIYEKLLPVIVSVSKIMNESVRLKNGTASSTVIFLLEESSKIFIPWIERAAKGNNATDFTYTKKHGEADEKHSGLALRAACAEYAHTKRDEHIQEAFECTHNLLETIFSI